MEEAVRSQAKDVIIQLGISALVVLVLGYVGYKIAVLVINKWAMGDAKRTEQIGEGFRQMASTNASVMQQVNANHALVMQQVNDNHQHSLSVIAEHQAAGIEYVHAIRVELAQLDSSVRTALDLTPIRGVPFVRRPTPVPHEVEDDDDEEHHTPVDRPPMNKRAQTQPGAKKPTEYAHGRPRKG